MPFRWWIRGLHESPNNTDTRRVQRLAHLMTRYTMRAQATLLRTNTSLPVE